MEVSQAAPKGRGTGCHPPPTGREYLDGVMGSSHDQSSHHRTPYFDTLAIEGHEWVSGHRRDWSVAGWPDFKHRAVPAPSPLWNLPDFHRPDRQSDGADTTGRKEPEAGGRGCSSPPFGPARCGGAHPRLAFVTGLPHWLNPPLATISLRTFSSIGPGR